jgi:hypothetical protein
MSDPILYPERQPSARIGVANVTIRFTSHGAAAPDGLIDEAGVLDPDTPLTYAATGKVTLNLAKRSNEIRLISVAALAVDDTDVKFTARTEGTAAANTVQIQYFTPSTGAGLASDDVETEVRLQLIP